MVCFEYCIVNIVYAHIVTQAVQSIPVLSKAAIVLGLPVTGYVVYYTLKFIRTYIYIFGLHHVPSSCATVLSVYLVCSTYYVVRFPILSDSKIALWHCGGST